MSTPSPEAPPKARLCALLPPDDIQTLRRLMRAMGHGTPAATLVRAIRALADIYDAHKRGDTILIRDRQGQETHLWLL